MPDNIRRAIGPAVRWTVEKIMSAAMPAIPAPLAAQQILPGPVWVAGYTKTATGIGKAARLTFEAIDHAGYTAHMANIAALDTAAVGSGDGVLLLTVNPPELPQAFAALGVGALQGRYRIGCWVWELPAMPESWARYARYFHEIWVPSRFVADAVRARLPEAQKDMVRIVPHPVTAPAAKPDRAAFGLPEDVCVVLSLFDLNSSFARKNPFAAINAFQRAAQGTKALLVLKAGNPEAAPYLYKELQERVAGSPNIRLFTEALDDTRAQSLIASSDIILSLHRAEGFGLVLAEAMGLGKPVVATSWSGNTDFMDADSSALVRYTFVKTADPQGIYYGQQWADPDVAHAAEWLHTLIRDPERRRSLGEKARQAAEEFFAPDRFTSCLSADFHCLAAKKTGR